MLGIVNLFRDPFKKYGTGTIYTLCLVYFAQGFRYFAEAAKTLYFKNTIGLSAADATLITNVITFSWYVKPLYGLISDSFPFLGYHRKSYLFATGVLGIISYSCFLFPSWYSVSIVAFVLGELSQAVADVIADGLMVEKSKIDIANGANDLQRYSFGSFMSGAVLGTALGGNAADYIEPKYLIASLAFCPLLVVLSSLSIDEEKVPSRPFGDSLTELWNNLKTFWYAVRNLKTLRIAAFAVLWLGTLLNFSAIFVYYMYDVLLLNPSTVSYIGLVGWIGMLLATVFGSNSLVRLGIMKRLVVGRILASLLNISDIIIWKRYDNSIGIHYSFFLFGGGLLGDFVDMLFCRMPILIVYARMTPKHIEATFFSLLCSANNLGRFLSGILVAAIMKNTGIQSQYDSNAWILSLISMGVGFLSLFLLFLMPKDIIEEHILEDKLLVNDNDKNSSVEPLLSHTKDN